MEWFIEERYKLIQTIHVIRKRELREYPHHHYFNGYPYQSLGILNIFGLRATEERFYEYELHQYLSKDNLVLDLGCNCGFMAIFTAYKIGCKFQGIDINPFSIEIGNKCAEFLKLSDKVQLRVGDISNSVTGKFDSIFAFATQWTTDQNYRVELEEYLIFWRNFLNPMGYFFFESHTGEDKAFLQKMNDVVNKGLFKIIKMKKVMNNSRYFYILQRNA